MHYSPNAIRTIALVGHAGCGKTSLVEALLHQGGALHTPGSVERGTTVCDFDPLERKYQHSLSSAVATRRRWASCSWVCWRCVARRGW